ncbi:sporulation protein [Thalassobacillus hwangdonensis]|uniref:Sporulation protein n=1 Tax=Thalassobacillus hwangdonensis TaxID=546108 RepID=A0ABW3L022_9BACI
MFKKMMASMGVGAAKVDLQLEKDQFLPGEEVSGRIVITGGNVEQQIDGIRVFLMTEAVREVNDRKVKERVELKRYHVAQNITIGEQEEKVVPFSVILPYQTPVTMNRIPVWFETGLDIPRGLDPNDRDPISVSAHPYVLNVLDAVEKELGFQMRKVEMEYSKRLGYVQEFEFYPGGEFRGHLDELELIFNFTGDGLDLFMQVDRKVRGLGSLFAEALEMDESNVRLHLTEADLKEGPKALARRLGELIRQHI